jgi:DNA primase large subunit
LARLLNTFQYMNATQFDAIDFYKVPFRRVLDLVKNRKVLLEKGQAYVSSNDLGNLIASKLRQEISHSLAVSLNLTSKIKKKLSVSISGDAAVPPRDICRLETGNYKPTTTSTDVLRIEDLDEVTFTAF